MLIPIQRNQRGILLSEKLIIDFRAKFFSPDMKSSFHNGKRIRVFKGHNHKCVRIKQQPAKCMKQKPRELLEEIHKFTIIVGDFNISLNNLWKK